MAKVTVLQVVRSTSELGVSTAGMRLQDVAGFVRDGADDELCERAFAVTNSIEGAWYDPEQARGNDIAVHLEARSTSVGDYVLIAGDDLSTRLYRCTNGWDLVSDQGLLCYALRLAWNVDKRLERVRRVFGVKPSA